jgi:hypothetical protein
MSLLLLLLKVSPINAVLWATALAMISGVGVYVAGALVVLGREPAPPPPVEAPKPLQPDETRLFSAKDIPDGPALDQTVRIEPGSLDYILPEISPEQVLKEREGLDIGALEEGIEASRIAREDSGKGEGQGGI